MKRAFSISAWTGSLVAAVFLLATIDVPDLPPAEQLSFTALRIVALLLGTYLLATTLAGIVARALNAAAAVSVLNRFTLSFVRRLLGTAMAVSISAGPLSVQARMAWAEEPTTAPVLRRAPAVDTTTTTTTAPPSITTTTASTTTTAGTSTTTTPTTPTSNPVVLPQEEPNPAPPDNAKTGRTRTIAPGQHLWAVAEQALADAWGRAPSDAEIAPYWTDLVLLNRPGLPDPSNPDLVFPGHTVVLPEIATPKVR